MFYDITLLKRKVVQPFCSNLKKIGVSCMSKYEAITTFIMLIELILQIIALFQEKKSKQKKTAVCDYNGF